MHGSRTTVIAVFVLIAATAAVHGVAANRWTGGDAAPEMPTIPSRFGDWVGEDQKTEVADPGITNLTRKYTHAKSGRSLMISLSYGHPRFTAVHTPEYCYRGSGYEMSGDVARRSVDRPGGPASEFWTTCFQKPSATGGMDSLRIFWAWSSDGAWRAADHPRLSFVGTTRLAKLYIVAPGTLEAAAGADPVFDEFLSGLLVCLDRSLFDPSTRR